MRTTSTLFSILIVAGVSAQCNLAIAPLSTVVTSAGPLVSANNEAFWVCPGASPTFAGTGNTIAIENGAIVSITGDDNTVSAKTFLGVAGDNNTIYTTDASLVLDQGTGNTIIQCASVVFDYTNAPSNGCAVGIEEEAALVQVQLLPNPVQDLLTITSGNSTVLSVQVVDMAGRVALNAAGNTQTTIDVAALPAGIYVVQVFTNNGTAVRRVVKG